MNFKRIITCLLALICVLLLCACGNSGKEPADTGTADDTAEIIAVPMPAVDVEEDGVYTSRDEVAAYIYRFHRLPSNYITKSEARALGWEGGSVEEVAPGKSIGGSAYGNYDGSLPDMPGRHYYECDVDTLGADSRGAKRIIYSNDGLIFYTEDHYETFILMYGDQK